MNEKKKSRKQHKGKRIEKSTTEHANGKQLSLYTAMAGGALASE